jgi:acyl transferase domain-containing protein
MSVVKQALREIRDLRAQLARTEAARSEPIAIIGMGLRFPGGAHDADSFASLLWSGADAVSEIPPDRWPLDALYASDPDAPGKLTTRYGAFLQSIDQFDAELFGISPREAASMDPQQRLMLEVSWEALEDAGHAPAALDGTSAGVYFGLCNSDYGRLLLGQRELLDAYVGTGNAHSVTAGRLSYILGLRGPSIAVDTACSSSLVALHLACQALRLGECDMALAGGCNLILTPDMNIIFSKARMMAPDGRCKTFDLAADGYVRGEGCAVIVLRRLADALSDGDRILAVIRGSAVNQDGRSSGLTAPNGPAQEAVIRAALEAARLSPSMVGYVEAHGTGTALGDPIEVGALGAVFGPGRDARLPLLIGSVKTNIGHLEAAAGVAGVIKVILAMQRGELPPHLHFHTGNPHIDWAALPLTVTTATTPWAPIDGRRVAGVSSFGFSGCNAHVILEAAPPPVERRTTSAERPLHLLALSARDRASLRVTADRYQSALSGAIEVGDACYTANVGRSHFHERFAVLGATGDELRHALSAFVEGDGSAAAASGRVDGGAPPQIAFLFTGQGAQYPGMGAELSRTSPVFRRALEECAAELAPYLDVGLDEILRSEEGTGLLHRTAYAQPAIFALEYALWRLWRSWGIDPVVVFGHSLGEYAAACASGLLSLREAARLVAERGRLTEALAADGAMATVFADEHVVADEIYRSNGALTVAAYNGPANHVLSGDRRAIAAAIERINAAGLRAKPLQLGYAAHSSLIDPVLPPFRSVLQTAQFETPRIALISGVTGELAGPETGRPDYWLTHMRAPVRFAAAMNTLAAMGITHFIEIGPHPVLSGMGSECLADQEIDWLPSLRRDRDDWSEILDSVRRLYVAGVNIDWCGFDRDYARQRIALPTYPFNRRRYWIDAAGPNVREVGGASAATRRRQITEAVGRQSEQGPLDLNAGSYKAKWDCLARLTLAHVVQTLREVGLFARPREIHTFDHIVSAMGAESGYRRLLRRWLDQLVSSGILRTEGDSYIADAALPDADMAKHWVEADALFADNRPLLNYVRHCDGMADRVIRGLESPLETLFPHGAFDLAEALYERSATMRYVNSLAAAAVAVFAGTLPAGRRVRAIEVGAGTGATTSALIPVLPADQTHYLFTDVSDVFLGRARERFGANAPMAYGRFDLDQDLAKQGYSPASFDLIVSANAVHASVDLRASLHRLRLLLAPGGMLVLIESTMHFPWFDLTTGLIEGWRHFADDLRTDHPLLGPADWLDALRETGFEASHAWPGSDSLANDLGQHVIIAFSSGESSEVEVASRFENGSDTLAPPPAGTVDGAFRARILEAYPTERLALLRDLVRDQVIGLLRRDVADPPGRNDRLMDLGLDSLMAVQLRRGLTKALGLAELPSTLMFDHPTIERLASYLLERLTPRSADEATTFEVSASAPLGPELIAAMSDSEIEMLLDKRLAQQQNVE